MSDTSTHEEPTTGKVLSDKRFIVTDALLTDYFEGLNLDRTAFDGGTAPVPSLIAASADSYFGEAAFSQQRGHLWMRQEWSFTRPLESGREYVTHAHIKDIYRKRNRTVVNTAIQVTDEGGDEVLTTNHHQSFLLDAPVDQVEFRDPNKKPGARKFIVPEGTALEGFQRSVSLEMCGQYFHGSKSYHTDKQASRELGFHEVVVGGAMTMSYIGHLLDGHWGKRWFESGRMDLKFTNPCWPDDLISIKGVATEAGDDPERENVFAWIEKEDGTIVLIVNASVAS